MLDTLRRDGYADLRMKQPTCPTCATAMRPGVMLDRGRSGTDLARWLDGEPAEGKMLGLSTGLDTTGALPVRGYRCPDCGRLDLFALEREL